MEKEEVHFKLEDTYEKKKRKVTEINGYTMLMNLKN